MSGWGKRARGAIGMGLSWAAAWAVGGMLIGATSVLFPNQLLNGFFEIFDAPLPALALPGFVAGALFSVVLGVAGRRRTFEQLSVPRVAAWGAFGGLLLSLTPAALAGLGALSTVGSPHGLWQITVGVSGPFILLSAASAAGSLALARRAERSAASVASARTLLGAGPAESPRQHRRSAAPSRTTTP